MRACLVVLAVSAACGGDVPAGAPDAPPADAVPPFVGPPEYVFDDGQVRDYQLEIAPSDWAWLNANAQVEQYVPGYLRFEGATIGPIGVRYKGGFGTLDTCFDAAGNRTCSKLSLKLDFAEYDSSARFYGLKKLNLHSMKSDPSQLRDRLAYWLYRQAGVPAPRAVHARVRVNGELLGLFAVVEQVDGRFTQHARDNGAPRFPDGGQGNLYKEVWPVHLTEAPYQAALATNEGASAGRMLRFAQALAAADDTTFRAVIASWMDLPTLARYLAADRLIDHWDGIVGWYCVGGLPCFNHNYYWYEQTDADRVWLIPWDMDNTAQVPSPIRSYFGMPDWNASATDCAPRPIFAGIDGLPPACDPVIHRLATALWDDYAAETRSLLAGAFAPGTPEAKLDAWAAQIEANVAEDPNGPGLAAWSAAKDELRRELTDLRARVSTQIGP